MVTMLCSENYVAYENSPTLFETLPPIEILSLPIHDYQTTPMARIWQDYFDHLHIWERQNKQHTQFIYDALALQMDINVLPHPTRIDGLNLYPIPKRKLDEAVERFQKTKKILEESIAQTVSAFIN